MTTFVSKRVGSRKELGMNKPSYDTLFNGTKKSVAETGDYNPQINCFFIQLSTLVKYRRLVE